MTNILVSDLFIEVLGAITGLIYLYFSIKQNIWLWPLGIITSLLYVYVFFQSKFYAGMSLQVYYFAISIYGWYFWQRGNNKGKDNKLPVIRVKGIEWIIFILITLVLSLVFGYFLDNYTDSPLPYWDAFTTSGSVVATWMLVRKYLEQWLFWIVIDLVSIGTYIYKGLFPTVILFSVYTVMAYIGYKQWRKELTNKSVY
jgi:nicotinamide mononucleotide transporter